MALAAVLLAAGAGYCQRDTVWTRTLSGTGNGEDMLRALVSDSLDNLYAAILNRPGDSTFGTITAKYSPTGQLLWSRRLVGLREMEPAGLAVDRAGNVFVAGSVRDEVGGWYDAYLAKYSAVGDSCWVRYYDAEGQNDLASTVLADSLGNAYLVGTGETQDRYEDMLLAKYSAAGELLWARLFDFQQVDDYGLAGTLDPSGNVYTAGAVCNWESDEYDMQVLKYSGDGTLLWQQTVRGPGVNDDSAIAVTTDAQGNVVVAGCTHESVTRGGFCVAKLTSAGDTLWTRSWVRRGDEHGAVGVDVDPQCNVFVAANNRDSGGSVTKYSSTGQEQWRRARMPDDSVAGLTVDGSGNCYLAGMFGPAEPPADGYLGVVKFAPSGEELWYRSWAAPDPRWESRGTAVALTSNGVAVGGHLDDLNAVTVRYDSAGNKTWARRFGGPGQSRDGATEVAFAPDGGVVAAGFMDNTNSGRDIAVSSYSASGELRWLRTYGYEDCGDEEASALALDDVGNVHVTGSSYTEATGYDYVSLKYDRDGTRLWASRYDGPAHGDDKPVALAVDPAGNVTVTGSSFGIGTDLDYATVRYSATGQELWVRRYNGGADTADMAVGVVVDSSGAAFVAGYSAHGLHDTATTIMYDHGGTVIWTRKTLGVHPTYRGFWVSGIAWSPDGNLCLAGSGAYSYLAAELSRAGDSLWINTCPCGPYGALATAMAVDEEGRIYVTGYGETDTTSYDWVTACFAADGRLLWNARLDGPAHDGDRARCAVAVPGVGVSVTGSISNSFSLEFASTVLYDTLGRKVWIDSFAESDWGVNTGYSVAGGPSSRIAVAARGQVPPREYDLVTILYAPVPGVGEFANGPGAPRSALEANPNPFRSVLSLRMAGTCDGPAHIHIFSEEGRLVRTLPVARGTLTVGWDGLDEDGMAVPAGVYFARPMTGLAGVAREPSPRPYASVKFVKLE